MAVPLPPYDGAALWTAGELIEKSNGTVTPDRRWTPDTPVSPFGDGMDTNGLDPIAIIGFSFVFPNDATTPESLWSMLVNARCASKPWPEDRLNGSAIYHPDGDRYDSVWDLCTLYAVAGQLIRVI